jgi:hypothetical protein
MEISSTASAEAPINSYAAEGFFLKNMGPLNGAMMKGETP